MAIKTVTYLIGNVQERLYFMFTVALLIDFKYIFGYIASNNSYFLSKLNNI